MLIGMNRKHLENEMKKVSLKCSRCTKCCQNTEMEITDEEILNLERMGFERNKFIICNAQYQKLKNIDGYCYFFNRDTNECNIYETRPIGCIFYPIIFNDNVIPKCEIDTDCDCYHDNKKVQIPVSICEDLKNYISILDKQAMERK